VQIREGKSVLYQNGGSAIANGDVVIMGNTVGVALESIGATTGTGMVAVEGVYSIPKVTGAVIGIGQTVFWDVSAGNVDDNAATAAAGDIKNGMIAMESAGSGILAIEVKLTPGSGVVHS